MEIINKRELSCFVTFSPETQVGSQLAQSKQIPGSY